MGNSPNFQLLETLAEVLGGAVAATRMATDEGWISPDKLVGQSGLTVAPKLYIAFGISGASHHTVGMRDSKAVIAVNTNPHAAMLKISDLAIIGDAVEVIPAITNELLRLSNESQDISAEK
jgi:electron transfer flavoprotein alpha subunit